MFTFINIFLPPADLPWFALAVANLSANLLPLRPECAPTVRTELRTSCAQLEQLLRSAEAVADA